jgi:SAM-dependent methyltransferase
MFAANARIQDYSFADVVNLLRASALAERVNASIDAPKFQRILAKHQRGDYRYSKYFRKRTWLRSKTMRVLELGVDKLRRASILDLGCGPGYFLYVCKFLGHDVHGVDLPDDPFFNDMIDLFGITRTDTSIEAYRALPSLGKRFDLITAHQICFNGHASSALWNVHEWGFFLKDLKAHHLKPGGVVALEFNEEPSNEFYPDELRCFFEAMDARIFRGRVIIAGDMIESECVAEAAS